MVGVTCGALVSRLGDWCAGSCCASCVRFVFAVLFPSFWTVIPRGRWVRLLSGSLTLCGWGSSPLLSAGVHAPVCWGFPAFALAGGAWASLFSLSGPCSRGCRAAWADVPSGGVRVSPVYLRSGRCWCCRARLGNMLPVGVWLLGVVALIAYAVSGCPVTVPGWCSCGVSLFLAHGAVYRGCACALVCARLALCVACVGACCCASMRHCLSVAACCVACCPFVAVCIVCRLLCGCAFRERSCAYCDMVHVGLCGCAFDGDLGCRLLFTV